MLTRKAGRPRRPRRPRNGARRCRGPALVLTASILAGCAGPSHRIEVPATLPDSYIPLTVGPGPRYRPQVHPEYGRLGAAALKGADVSCDAGLGPRFGVHVELFANRHVVLIPPGIGVFAPVRIGAVVRGGRCYYPLVTLDPTGVVEVGVFARLPTLGALFVFWGHPLGATRLAGFAGHPIHAFVNGRPVRGDPADIRLRRHDEIVLETSGSVVPHAAYQFADGL